MSRRVLALVLFTSAVPTASLAQDFCAALNTTLNAMIEARDAATLASDAVSTFRFRLSEDMRRYRGDVEDLSHPSDSAATATNQLTTAVRDLTALKAARCPSIPDGR